MRYKGLSKLGKRGWRIYGTLMVLVLLAVMLVSACGSSESDVVKEVIKEVPVEKIVEKEVIREMPAVD